MSGHEWFVEKITSTPADALPAFALAELIHILVPEDIQRTIRVEGKDDGCRVSLIVPLEAAWIENVEFFTLLKPLDTAKKKSGLPNSIDYVAHQQRNNAYFEARKKGLAESDLAEQGLTSPSADWPSWAIINQMAATSTYNKLIETWYAHRACFPDLLKIVFDLYGNRPNDVSTAEERWKALAKTLTIDASSQAPQLQVINPGMGKGGNKAKANGLSIGGLNGFWLVEYLKFVGLFHAALPRTVMGSKDRKTYVLRPKSLHWETHRNIFPEFQKAVYAQTAVKMDILATLRYGQVFLKQWKAGQGTGMFRFALRQPGDHIAALDVIHYKHLGSAHATMNLSTLILPAWLNKLETAEDATLFLTLLAEHEMIIRNLEEKYSQEYELLRRYRNFLSARDLEEFYYFTAGYADYVMSKLIKGGFPPRHFHIPNLEVLIVNHNPELKPIVDSPGFRRIAEAIRQSTVTPQYFKSKNMPGPYEIRYGLGADLLRNASYPEKFVQALAKFIFEYSQENARINERYKNKPPVRRVLVRTGDLEQVLALMDQYRDSETVANLLVAFGYAHDPRNPAEPETQGPALEDTDEESTGEASGDNDEIDEMA